MALTAPGRSLAKRAPRLLEELNRALQETRCSARQEAGVLRVGFLASAADEATPRIIAAFGRRRPDWKVEMRQAL